MLSSSLARVYLAGPNVFRPDAVIFGEDLKRKCAAMGLVGCFPLDNEVHGSSPSETAALIYAANLALIESSDAIVADISPFRGPNMDPGTAWEIGFGVAKGLPIFIWSDVTGDIISRTTKLDDGVGSIADSRGWAIEDFGLPENLMIAISATSIHASADQAIASCAAAMTKDRQ